MQESWQLPSYSYPPVATLPVDFQNPAAYSQPGGGNDWDLFGTPTFTLPVEHDAPLQADPVDMYGQGAGRELPGVANATFALPTSREAEAAPQGGADYGTLVMLLKQGLLTQAQFDLVAKATVPPKDTLTSAGSSSSSPASHASPDSSATSISSAFPYAFQPYQPSDASTKDTSSQLTAMSDAHSTPATSYVVGTAPFHSSAFSTSISSPSTFARPTPLSAPAPPPYAYTSSTPAFQTPTLPSVSAPSSNRTMNPASMGQLPPGLPPGLQASLAARAAATASAPPAKPKAPPGPPRASATSASSVEAAPPRPPKSKTPGSTTGTAVGSVRHKPAFKGPFSPPSPDPASAPPPDKRVESTFEAFRIGGMFNRSAEDKPKCATQLLAEGAPGMPSLAQLQAQLKPDAFTASLKAVMGKRNIVVQEPYYVDGRQVPLFDFYQAVIVQGGGVLQVDADQAWDRIALFLNLPVHHDFPAHLGQLYHRILAIYEEAWSTALLKQREKMTAVTREARAAASRSTNLLGLDQQLSPNTQLSMPTFSFPTSEHKTPSMTVPTPAFSSSSSLIDVHSQSRQRGRMQNIAPPSSRFEELSSNDTSLFSSPNTGLSPARQDVARPSSATSISSQAGAKGTKRLRPSDEDASTLTTPQSSMMTLPDGSSDLLHSFVGVSRLSLPSFPTSPNPQLGPSAAPMLSNSNSGEPAFDFTTAGLDGVSDADFDLSRLFGPPTPTISNPGEEGGMSSHTPSAIGNSAGYAPDGGQWDLDLGPGLGTDFWAQFGGGVDDAPLGLSAGFEDTWQL